jgi:hypothetical protein
MAVVRDDVIRALVQKGGMKDREAADFFDLMFDELRSAVGHGRPIRLTDFGSFRLIVTYKLGSAEGRRVAFSPLKSLRARLAAATESDDEDDDEDS